METCFHEARSIANAEGAKMKPEAVLEVMKVVPPSMRSSKQKDVEQHKERELRSSPDRSYLSLSRVVL
jgi:ketopantoate reductase